MAESNPLTTDSQHDLLTGLFNRQGFIQKTKDTLSTYKSETPLAILFFNIKQFKAFNELYGFNQGDLTLKRIGQELVFAPFNPIAVGRKESDHFLCLVKFSDELFEQLKTFCVQSVVIGNQKITIHLCCGIYKISNQNHTVPQMIDRAKLAKDYITDEYIEPYAVYDFSMKENYITTAITYSEFSSAIDENQFKVFFQPIVDVKTEKLIGAEALVRWEHPKRGMLSPAFFIDVLENNGYITQLDRYVAEHVIDLIYQRLENNQRIVPISINLSWMDMLDKPFVQWLANLFETNSELKDYLHLEVTETSSGALDSSRLASLKMLQSKGAKIFLDDFGSGYSSFVLIQNFDFDVIKLDMSFARKLESSEKTKKILHSLIDMNRSLGIQVVAEGIENKEQYDFFKSANCNFVQGFYHAKPMSGKQFIEFMNQH